MSVAVIAFRLSPRFRWYSRENADPTRLLLPRLRSHLTGSRSQATSSSCESSDLARALPQLDYLTAWDHERLFHKSRLEALNKLSYFSPYVGHLPNLSVSLFEGGGGVGGVTQKPNESTYSYKNSAPPLSQRKQTSRTTCKITVFPL